MTKAKTKSNAAEAGQVCEHGNRWTVYSQRELASAVGVDPSTVQQWVRDGFPRPHAGKNRYKYCIPCAAQWMRQVAASGVTQRSQVSDDPLLASSSDSPGLERYRAAKAEHAELDLAERRGELISVEGCREWIMAIMLQIRQFGDRLRSHPELQAEFADMLNDCKRLVETMDDHPKQ